MRRPGRWSRRRFLLAGGAFALWGGWALGSRADRSGRRGAAERRRARVRAEHGRGDVVVAGGWLLARAEAKLMAERGEAPGAPVPESTP